LLVSAAWGTIKLFREKSGAALDEGGWTFGQILPVFLLAAPLLALVEIFADPPDQSDDAELSSTNQVTNDNLLSDLSVDTP